MEGRVPEDDSLTSEGREKVSESSLVSVYLARV